MLSPHRHHLVNNDGDIKHRNKSVDIYNRVGTSRATITQVHSSQTSRKSNNFNTCLGARKPDVLITIAK